MYIHFDVAWTLLFHTEMPGSATCRPLLDECYRAHSDSVGDFVGACLKKRNWHKSSKSACRAAREHCRDCCLLWRWAQVNCIQVVTYKPSFPDAYIIIKLKTRGCENCTLSYSLLVNSLQSMLTPSPNSAGGRSAVAERETFRSTCDTLW